MKTKNIIAIAMSLCMLGSTVNFCEPLFNDSAITANAYYQQYYGNFGDDIRWYLETDGTLKIFGTGEMYSDYMKHTTWHNYCVYDKLNEKIKKIHCTGNITNIIDRLFTDLPNLESIYLENVENINYHAFENCPSLTSVEIGGNSNISGSAFVDCPVLSELIIKSPKSEIKNLSVPKTTVIKGYAHSTAQEFAEKNDYQFEELEDTKPPSGGAMSGSFNKKEMDVYAQLHDNETPITRVWLEFRIDDSEDWIEVEMTKYNNLTIDKIPYANSYVGHASFALSGLTSASVVHYRINAMDSAGNIFVDHPLDWTISSDGPVQLDTIKDTVTKDGITYLIFNDHAEVYDCEKTVKDKVIIPPTINGFPVTKVSGFAFKYCSKITEVILPDTITEIRRDAFMDCTSLKSIYIPESLEKIEACVFENCSSLKEITIPKKINKIPSSLLSSCTNLTDVYIMNPKCQFSKYNINNTSKDDEVFYGTIHGYKGSEAQTSAEKYNYNFEVIPVTEITLKVGEQYTIDE
ncbi:MAG: leucine-rich repeat domain-containing protein, partial [Ruminococcus sp.]|nr:leucine-rich repeat domain-containing protein [Ruminococcus sp.]